MCRSIEALFTGEQPPQAALAGMHPFLRQIRNYLAAGVEERAALVDDLRARAARLREEEELDPLAAGVALLVLGLGGAPSRADTVAVELAREFTDEAVAERLVVHLGAEREEEARESWLRIAAQFPDVMAPILADALADDRDRGARRAYLAAMKSLGAAGRARAIEMLEDDRWFVVRNGVNLLADFGDQKSVGQLTATLAHPDARVRRETVMALAKLGGEDAALLLLGLLDDGEVDVREAATRAVGVLRVEKALRPLLARLEEEESEDVVVQILRSLGQLGDPGAVPAIEKRAAGGFFARRPVGVRIAAYRALAAIGTPHARGVVEKGAEDGDPAVRTAVTGILSARAAPGDGGSDAADEHDRPETIGTR